MTGPQHYLEAEKILRQVAEHPGHLEGQPHLLAVAQVHATLAHAAATALDPERLDALEWADVAGSRLSG